MRCSCRLGLWDTGAERVATDLQDGCWGVECGALCAAAALPSRVALRMLCIPAAHHGGASVLSYALSGSTVRCDTSSGARSQNPDASPSPGPISPLRRRQ